MPSILEVLDSCSVLEPILKYVPIVDLAVEILSQQVRLNKARSIFPFVSKEVLHSPVFEQNLLDRGFIELPPLEKVTNQEWLQWFCSLLDTDYSIDRNVKRADFLPAPEEFTEICPFSHRNHALLAYAEGFFLESRRRALRLEILKIEVDTIPVKNDTYRTKLISLYRLLVFSEIKSVYVVHYCSEVFSVFDKTNLVIGFDFDRITFQSFWKFFDNAILSIFYNSDRFNSFPLADRLDFTFDSSFEDVLYVDAYYLKPKI